ncbi:hypothetical protein H8S20_02500 [Clostridium sp. NSJ-6]|uniref:Lipoprotein n=1 Tax=Clostridium hominis TaxID=2763036 RepID=A0ABR7D8P8_9CLOT|nr:hypothetical protein [Clostridium hominis]MBC5627754.1 hypothetical protein [Clostridium hominis]MDU2672989.1 hypothetical protein [Clostridium sp.]
MIIRKKYKKLIGISLVASTIFIFAGCSTKDDTIGKESGTEEEISSVSNTQKTPVIEDLSKIENLKNLKFEKDSKANFLSFDEVIDLIGSKGEVVYPEEGDDTLKVMYWIYEEDGIEYFLDTTFFMDKLVNIESRIVLTSEIVDISSKSLDTNYINDISDIKSYSTLKEILGEGTIVMKYFIPTNDRIYIWKYNEEFISAYVSEEDLVTYIETSSDVNTLIRSSTNCH